MLNENVLLLGSSTDSEHGAFINLLKNNLFNINFLSNKEEFISCIESFLSSCSNTEASLLVLFVEFPFLNEISLYLGNISGGLNYILTAYSSRNQESVTRYDNLFEFINTDNCNMDFFFKKLSNEIDNKKKISFLKDEVKEFYEIGKSLSSEKDTVKLLDMIVTSSMNLTSSDAGTIYLVIDKDTFNWTSVKNNNYDDKILKFVIAKNTSLDVNLETFTSPITRESIFGYSVITGEAVRIDDVYNLSPNLTYRHNNSFDLHTGYITKSMLTIPMKDHENNILGVIQLINKKKFKDEKIDYSNKESLNSIIPFDCTDELIMSSLAGQAAVVLENNLLYRDMQNLLESYKTQNNELEVLSKKILKAHEEERKRIAREIHDGPAQAVVNLSLKIELTKKFLQNSMYEKGFEELDSLNTAVKSTSKEIRTILYDLKPSYLEDGLIRALENRFGIYEESTGIKVAFKHSGDDTKIEYYLCSTIYRMVQESLSNIHKHAKARNVVVDFSVNDDTIYVTVTDDGVGFDMDQQAKKHQSLKGGFGLGGLRERAELVKGKVSIKSAPGKGTTVSICIPL
ncbi:MAG: GAF domain-containing sensor histidine kinase [Bacillota bacterium]